MTNKLLDQFLAVFPDFHSFREQPILDKNRDTIGWNSVAMTNNGKALSNGTAITLEVARRIAVAEAIERNIVKKLIYDRSKEFMMVQVPSSSGCAVGFDFFATRNRSICEGLERWAWSQWIDSGCLIDRIEIDSDSLSPLARHFQNNFDCVYFFRKSLTSDLNFFGSSELQFGVVLCFSGNGIYPGSRMAPIDEDLWTHGFIEANRNFVIANLNGSGHKDSIILDRLKFFAKNKELAISQVNKAINPVWPESKLLLCKPYLTGKDEGYYFWRSLFSEYVPWHLGSESRFVY